MLPRHRQHLRHILGKAQLTQGLVDVFGRDRLLGLALGDLVGLGGDEGDELDAAVDQEVTGVFAKGDAGVVAEDFGDDFLHGCCFEGGGKGGKRLVMVAFAGGGVERGGGGGGGGERGDGQGLDVRHESNGDVKGRLGMR